LSDEKTTQSVKQFINQKENYDSRAGAWNFIECVCSMACVDCGCTHVIDSLIWTSTIHLFSFFFQNMNVWQPNW
jgi:hypothetical protein